MTFVLYIFVVRQSKSVSCSVDLCICTGRTQHLLHLSGNHKHCLLLFPWDGWWRKERQTWLKEK